MSWLQVLIVPSIRYKDCFFLDDQTAQRARHLLVQLIEEQVEAAAGGNNNERDAVQGEAQEEEEEAGSSSILNNMRKRICRSRERNMEVAILRKFFEINWLIWFTGYRIISCITCGSLPEVALG